MSHKALHPGQFQEHLFEHQTEGPPTPEAKPEKVWGKRAGLGQGSMIRNWGDRRPPEVRMEAMAWGPKHYHGK